MKILYLTSLSGKRINSFMLSSILAANKSNYQFDIAFNMNEADIELLDEDCNKLGIKYYNICFQRNPLNIKNIVAYKQLNRIIKEGHYDVIHCNTVIAGILGRLCGKKNRVPKIIYMVHGFHFHKKSSFLKWIMYYPVEKFMSRYNDYTITINKEDYAISKKMHSTNNIFVHGVGVNIERIDETQKKIDKEKVLKENGIANDRIIITNVGELRKLKNQLVLIKSMKNIVKENNNVVLLICGKGKLEEKYKKYIKKNRLEQNVKLLGFKDNVLEILLISDIFVFPSYREGLSAALMEAMACGLPIVCSNIRGNNDLVKQGVNGYLCYPNKMTDIKNCISLLINDEKLRKVMGIESKKIIKNYDINNSISEINSIYNEIEGSLEK